MQAAPLERTVTSQCTLASVASPGPGPAAPPPQDSSNGSTYLETAAPYTALHVTNIAGVVGRRCRRIVGLLHHSTSVQGGIVQRRVQRGVQDHSAHSTS